MNRVAGEAQKVPDSYKTPIMLLVYSIYVFDTTIRTQAQMT
jgi:hypothetical protein